MRGQNSGKKWKKIISEIPKLKETLKEQINSRDNVLREREVKNEDNFKKKTKKQNKKEKSRDKKVLRESGHPASGPCVTLTQSCAALLFHVNSHSTALSNSMVTHLTCHFTGCHTANNLLYFFLSFPNILKIENTPHTMKWTRGWQPNSCTAGNQHRYLSTA